MPGRSSAFHQDDGQPASTAIGDHPNDDLILFSIASVFENHYNFELPRCRFTKAEDKALLHLLRKLRANWIKRIAKSFKQHQPASSAPLRKSTKSKAGRSSQPPLFQIEDSNTVFGGPRYVEQAFCWPEDTKSFRDTFGYGGPEKDKKSASMLENKKLTNSMLPAHAPSSLATISNTVNEDPTNLRPSSSLSPSPSTIARASSSTSSTRRKNRAVDDTTQPAPVSTAKSVCSDGTEAHTIVSATTQEVPVFTQSTNTQRTIATVPDTDEGASSILGRARNSEQSSSAQSQDRLQLDLPTSSLSFLSDADMEQPYLTKSRTRGREDEESLPEKQNELAADTNFQAQCTPKRRKI